MKEKGMREKNGLGEKCKKGKITGRGKERI